MYPYGTGKSKTLPTLNEAFYVSLSRIAWPLGLSWVVFACMQGYGGLANSFLTSPLWQPLSKLSFCAYMGHLFIQNLNAGRTRVNTYFSNYDIVSFISFSFKVINCSVLCSLTDVAFLARLRVHGPTRLCHVHFDRSSLRWTGESDPAEPETSSPAKGAGC